MNQKIYKQKKLTSKISVDSNFTFTTLVMHDYVHLALLHLHRLIDETLSKKLLSFHKEMISA